MLQLYNKDREVVLLLRYGVQYKPHTEQAIGY